MDNYEFTFQCPTKIYFRPGGVSEIGAILSHDYRIKKVFLVYGGKSLKKYGTYDKVINSLNENGVVYSEYGGIASNPDLSDVMEMVKSAREFQPELILAMGGGSVLDAAKSLAHAYYYDGNPIDFNKHLVTPLHALPVATILTLAASGSEMSDSCVISDRKHHFKAGFNAISNYPLFSLMDCDLTSSVPPYQIGVGLADMFSHSMERFYSASHEFEPCDDMALAVMKNIVQITPRIISHPEDREARRAMMICGSLAHNGFTSYGKNKVFIVHKAEHMLSGKYPELLHGQGIALLMPRYLEINKAILSSKIKKMGKVIFDSDGSEEDAIECLRKWILQLPIAHNFAELPFEIKGEDLVKADKLLTLSKK